MFFKKIKLEDEGNFKGKVFNIDFAGLDIKQLAVFYREKGLKTDGHFHKGNNPSRDPEISYVLKGKMKISFEGLDGAKDEVILEEGEGLVLEKMVFHKYEILEDVIFIEPKAVPEKELPDTFDHQEFISLKK